MKNKNFKFDDIGDSRDFFDDFWFNFALSSLLADELTKDYKLSYDNFKMLSYKGDPEAQYYLGCMYKNGLGVKRDIKEAKKYFNRAFHTYFSLAKKNGDSKLANYYLGLMYRHGHIFEKKDSIRAFNNFLESAKQGYDKSQLILGYLYKKGDGTNQDYNQAINWFSKSAEQGNLDAKFLLALIYENTKDIEDNNYETDVLYQEVFAEYKDRAENGGCLAQLTLGYMYFEGLGTEKDYIKAFEWCKKSADQNYDEAQFMLANMYFEGLGIEQDYIKAIEYYKKSAEQGNDLAEYRLGEIYEQGIEVEKDNKQSFEWYKKSAEQDNFRAQCRLGDIFYKEYNDFDVKQDINNAIEWFNKSIEQDYEKAKKELGLLYLNLGDTYYSKYEELSKDCEKSEEYYKKSAEHNNRAKVKLRDNFEGYEIYIGSDEEQINW